MRIFTIVAAAGTFLGSIGYSASGVPAANTGNLDFKQWDCSRFRTMVGASQWTRLQKKH
jgi:hypothetical protein